MMNLKISKEAVPIVRSGLKIEKNIAKFSLDEYKQELNYFEKKYKMKTREFIRKFKKGELGDKSVWFDWLFAYKAYRHVKRRLELFKGISI